LAKGCVCTLTDEQTCKESYKEQTTHTVVLISQDKPKHYFYDKGEGLHAFAGSVYQSVKLRNEKLYFLFVAMGVFEGLNSPGL
jgi:hypothetical protein